MPHSEIDMDFQFLPELRKPERDDNFAHYKSHYLFKEIASNPNKIVPIVKEITVFATSSDPGKENYRAKEMVILLAAMLELFSRTRWKPYYHALRKEIVSTAFEVFIYKWALPDAESKLEIDEVFKTSSCRQGAAVYLATLYAQEIYPPDGFSEVAEYAIQGLLYVDDIKALRYFFVQAHSGTAELVPFDCLTKFYDTLMHLKTHCVKGKMSNPDALLLEIRKAIDGLQEWGAWHDDYTKRSEATEKWSAMPSRGPYYGESGRFTEKLLGAKWNLEAYKPEVVTPVYVKADNIPEAQVFEDDGEADADEEAVEVLLTPRTKG